LNPTFDVIIVGAGIVGAACAVECARAGLKVSCWTAPVGGGTTGAGMGHLVVMDDSEAQFALTHYSRQLWNTSPRSCLRRSNTTNVAPSGLRRRAGDAEVRRKASFYTQRGVQVEVLDTNAVAAAEPNLRPTWPAGCGWSRTPYFTHPAQRVASSKWLKRGRPSCAPGGRHRPTA